MGDGIEQGSAAEVRAVVRRHVPALSAASVRPLGAGRDHVVWLVDGTLAVRMPRTGAGGERVPGAAARREAAVLRFAADRSPLPVPAVAFVDDSSGALAYPLLPGVPLIDLLQAPSRAVDLVAVGSALGSFLRSLHTPQARRWAEQEGVERDVQEMAGWLEDARQGWPDAARAVEDPAIAAAVRGFLEAPPPGAAPEDELVLSHNDLGAEHVLADIESAQITGIIDFGDAAVVDPAYDFGLIERDLGAGALAAALAAYGRRRATARLRARALFYARCSAIEDLQYGVLSGREPYVRKTIPSLSRLFPPERGAPAGG